MKENYYKLFGIDDSDVRLLMKTALSKGGDFVDIFFEHNISDELSLRDGEVNAVSSNIDYGVGIRVVSGDKTGYSFSETTTLKDMTLAATTAAEIASMSHPPLSYSASPTMVEKGNYYPIISQWKEHSITERKEYLSKLNVLVFQADKRVHKVIAKLSYSNSKVLYFNSLGGIFCDDRPMSSLNVLCIMKDGDRIENFTASRSFRCGFEFLSDHLMEILADEVVKGCSRLFGASQPPCGEMPVVMGAGGSGILLHEAIGHAFEADFNRKKVSIFSERMGQKICDENISVVDDGTLLANRGSINIDDEGVPSQKTYMVRNGILNSFLHDRISAKFYNTAPTGNGRRESFRYMPLPRMRATYMENGNCKEEELIHAVKKGIFVDCFSNGEVQIGAGDFTFFVKSGYLIEDGKLTRPIKDANIIGNGPQALSDIQAVADNLKIDNGTWTCGKGQLCPVSCGMPSVLIKSLTVGGINQ